MTSELLHDQGTQFISSVMHQFNELLKIKSINMSSYYPRCNGTFENFSKSLKHMIRKMSAEVPQTLERYLQPLLIACREVPQVQ